MRMRKIWRVLAFTLVGLFGCLLVLFVGITGSSAAPAASALMSGS